MTIPAITRDYPQWGLTTKFWRQFQVTLATNGETTFTVQPQADVDSWIVSVLPITGGLVQIYPGESPSNFGMVLGGGGSCRLPGNGASLFIRNAGANNTQVIAVAERGYPWIAFSPGQIV